MTAIQFAIDEAHTVECRPERGDPNELFRQGQTLVVDAVEDQGYAFEEGASPDCQEFVAAFEPGSNEIALGDLSHRVRPVDVSDQDDAAEDTVTLDLVGREGESLELSFRESQNLGAVTASLADQYNLGLQEQVVVFPTDGRAEALPTDTLVGELPTSTLYWGVTTVEEGGG